MRRAFEEELKKTPSSQSGKTPASQHQKIHITPACTPAPVQSKGCTLPAVSPWADTHSPCASRQGKRDKNSKHLAGGRCEKFLAEHKTESNFKISIRHLTALKRAASVFVCLYNALRGRMQELGTVDVMGTYRSAGRCGANEKHYR